MYQSWKYVGNLSLSSRFITKPVRDPDEYFWSNKNILKMKKAIKNSPRLSSAWAVEIYS